MHHEESLLLFQYYNSLAVISYCYKVFASILKSPLSCNTMKTLSQKVEIWDKDCNNYHKNKIQIRIKLTKKKHLLF